MTFTFIGSLLPLRLEQGALKHGIVSKPSDDAYEQIFELDDNQKLSASPGFCGTNLTSPSYNRSRDVATNRIKASMELRSGDNRVGERLSAWAVRPADD